MGQSSHEYDGAGTAQAHFYYGVKAVIDEDVYAMGKGTLKWSF